METVTRVVFPGTIKYPLQERYLQHNQTLDGVEGRLVATDNPELPPRPENDDDDADGDAEAATPQIRGETAIDESPHEDGDNNGIDEEIEQMFDDHVDDAAGLDVPDAADLADTEQ